MTLKTTLHGTSDSTHISLDLNGEATDSKDVEVQKVRPIRRDMSKKKTSSFTACSESSFLLTRAGIEIERSEASGASEIKETKACTGEKNGKMRLAQQRELEEQMLAHERQQFELT
ncbi:hypothetical protein Tco_1448602 [Tanacetum coccineum]